MEFEHLLNMPSWDWPEDAGRIIQKVLVDKTAKPDDRVAAAEMAGDVVAIDNELAEILLAIARSGEEPEDLRSTAAIALGPVLEYADTYEFEDELDEVPIAEDVFERLQEGLHALFLDSNTPKEVRRRALEAAVRAPQEWQLDVIRQEFSSSDPEWKLTAVFGMGYVRGFDREIMEALNSEHEEIRCEAVEAAGNWEVKDAWPTVLALLQDPKTPKPLLLAAIGAVAGIRPEEAPDLLLEFADSDDEEIADAADEALSLAEGVLGFDDDEELAGDEDDEEEEEDDEEDGGSKKNGGV